MSTIWPTLANQTDAIADMIFDRKTELLSAFPGQAATINANYANRPADNDTDGLEAIILYAANIFINPPDAVDSLLLEDVDASNPFNA